MLGFLCRFIGARILGWCVALLFSVLPVLLPSALFEEVEVDLLCSLLFLTSLDDLGLLAAFPSVQDGIPRDFTFGDALSLAGGTGGFERTATGDDGAVATMGEGGAEGGGEGTTEGVEGAASLVLVLIFLARLVLAFSSSSEEGYEPESCLTCLCSVIAVVRSFFASCARAPYDGARLKPEVSR
jgi:hypothetical protein